jgi:hypothetical protein
VLVDPAKDLTARPAKGALSIRHLLTHSGGLTYAFLGEGPLEREYRRLGLQPGTGRLGMRPGDGAQPELQGFAERLSTLPLVSDPGTAWRYSVSLDLLGRCWRRFTGVRWTGCWRTGVRAVRHDRHELPGARGEAFALTALPVQMSGKLVEVDAPPSSEWGKPPLILAVAQGWRAARATTRVSRRWCWMAACWTGGRVSPPMRCGWARATCCRRA